MPWTRLQGRINPMVNTKGTKLKDIGASPIVIRIVFVEARGKAKAS